jgi:hypothetical protein
LLALPGFRNRLAAFRSFVLVQSTECITHQRICKRVEIAPLVNDVTSVLALDRSQRHLGVMLASGRDFPQQLLLRGHSSINGSRESGWHTLTYRPLTSRRPRIG